MSYRRAIAVMTTAALAASAPAAFSGASPASAAGRLPAPTEDAADLILMHGVFYPLAPPAPPEARVEGALAVRAGRIVYLGPAAGAEALRDGATEVVDLGGRAVTPGLIDAHSHLESLGRALVDVDLAGAADFSEVVARVAAAAAELPAGAWVRGRGWDQTRWPGRAFPEHAALSAAVADRPAWLTRVDGHAVLLNARAMELLGVGETIADPPGGRFLRDAAGRPTGVLLDNAIDELAGKLPAPLAAERRAWVRSSAEHCVALGLTTVTDMGVGDATIAAYRELAAAGELPLRAALFLADDEALLARWLAAGPAIDPAARVTVRGVKLYADGALGSRGAALIEPYADDPGNLGLLTASRQHLTSVASKARAAGFQVGVHAIGDRGNLVALDALEAAMGGPAPELRWRIEHAQVMRLQDVERLARLGIIASMQPTHATSDMRWAEDRLGAARLAGAYAWRKVLAAGGRLALGSDFPVESPDPRLGLYAAVTRQDLDGRPDGGWLPGERLTRGEALAGFTFDAARSLFLDAEVGSLEVGKRADLVVWGGDPMSAPAASLPALPVDLTLVEGRVVHRREEAWEESR
jgi:hypothetical protein